MKHALIQQILELEKIDKKLKHLDQSTHHISSCKIPTDLYEQLREIAFIERTTISSLLMEGSERVVSDRKPKSDTNSVDNSGYGLSVEEVRPRRVTAGGATRRFIDALMMVHQRNTDPVRRYVYDGVNTIEAHKLTQVKKAYMYGSLDGRAINPDSCRRKLDRDILAARKSGSIGMIGSEDGIIWVWAGDPRANLVSQI